VGATVSVSCPVEGCKYSATFRLAMDEETNGVADRKRILRDEHPDHPAPEDQPSLSN